MVLDDRQQCEVEAFRVWVSAQVRQQLGLGAGEREDRPDGRSLITRWRLEPHFWHEITVRPQLLQVRVGLMTDDRYRSDDLRAMIETSGYTLQEFVGLALAGAGLGWPEPPVEHYCDGGRHYRLATPMDLRTIDQLADETLRQRVLKMATAYGQVLDGTAVA